MKPWLAVLCVALSFPSYAEPWPELDHLKATLARKVAQMELPNAVIAMSIEGKTQYFQQTGVLDIEAQTPLPNAPIFRLYSMSKPITSVAIMQLAERGLLDINDPVSQYIPAFANSQVYVSGDLDNMRLEPQQQPMTIADLLAHRSGITYHFTGDTPVHQYYRKHGVKRFTPVGSQPGDAPAAPDLATLVQRLADAPLLSQPGTRFDYSYSTTVLGRIVELASGQNLENYLQDNILQPLSMHDSSFFVTGTHLDRFVSNYVFRPDETLLRIENIDNTDYNDRTRLLDGGGAMASTAQDYLRFAGMLAQRGHLDGQHILSPSSVYRMFYPEVDITWGTPYPFGLGFAIGTPSSEAAGKVPAGMYGWSGSGNTHFFVDPELELAVVVMTQVIGDENAVGVKPAMVQAVSALRQRLIKER